VVAVRFSHPSSLVPKPLRPPAHWVNFLLPGGNLLDMTSATHLHLVPSSSKGTAMPLLCPSVPAVACYGVSDISLYQILNEKLLVNSEW
jgi:hypothetical protein